MKKLLKKAVLVILAMAMSISCLSLLACGDSDKDTLTFMAYQPASQVNQDKYKALLNKFTEQTGIKVKANFVVKDKYKTSFSSSLMSNKVPDLAYIDQPLIADYASNGQIEDLTDYFGALNGIKKEDFFSGAFDTVMYNGKIYGVPLNITSTVMFYNKDLVSESELPNSWEELLAIGENLPSGKALTDGIGNAGYSAWYFQAFLANNGGTLVNADKTAVTFNDEKGVETAKFLQDMYALSPKTIRDTKDAFGNGLVAFKLGSSSDIDNISQNFPQLNFGVMKMVPNQAGATSYSNIGGENLVITAKSTKKDKAKQLLEFLLQDDNIKQISEFTGNFSALKRCAETTDARKLVIKEQLETAQARPSIPKWIQVNDDFIGTALEGILAEGATSAVISEKLNTAANQATALLFK